MYAKTITKCEKETVNDSVRFRCEVTFTDDKGTVAHVLVATIDQARFPTAELVKDELRRVCAEEEARLGDADATCMALEGATL